MPRLRTLLALAPLLLTGGPVSAPMRTTVPEAIAITATPVTIQPDDPRRTRVGALDLVAGWKLTSDSRQFGGWSALFVEGDRVTTINDGGALLRFRLSRFGRPTGARVDALPAGCGEALVKETRDTESLARAPDGSWYVGYEWRNAICRVSPDFTRTLALAQPAAMRAFRRTLGAEAMLQLADGRLMVLAEGARERGATQRPMLFYPSDPTSAGARPVEVGYLPPPDYDPTDAVQLPDGRVLVLNRRFSVTGLFTAVIVAIDPAQIAPETLVAGATVTGTPIARFEPPVLADNFEGLAVTVEDGRPFVWMISDDNQLSWESTYLLRFAIDPQPAAARQPAPRRQAQERPPERRAERQPAAP